MVLIQSLKELALITLKKLRTTVISDRKKMLNIVMVGDGNTGKTSLLLAFQGKKLDTDYTSTVFETYETHIIVDDQDLELGLWDTASQEGYHRLRKLTYSNCDAVVLCYSVDRPDTLHNIIAKWLPEVEYFCPGVPKILAATKKDLRRQSLAIIDILNSNNSIAQFVSFEEGMCTAERIGAARFIETSTFCNESVKELFQHTARAALHEKNIQNLEKKHGRANCCIS